jgi:predicted ATPase
MDKCINCGKEIPDPVFKWGGRGCGKTMMLLYYNIRQMCCSDECFWEFMKKAEEELYREDEVDAYRT